MNCNQMNNLCQNENKCKKPKIIFVTDPNAQTGLTAYAGMYNTTTETIPLTADTTQQVPFNNTMPNLNTTYVDDSIQITSPGVYEINYSLIPSVSAAGDVTVAVRNFGTDIASTVQTKSLEADTETPFNGTTLVQLPSGAQLDLAITSSAEGNLTLGTGVNATLTVKKIN